MVILGDNHRMTHPVGFRANKMISDFTRFHPVPGKLQDVFCFDVFVFCCFLYLFVFFCVMVPTKNKLAVA